MRRSHSKAIGFFILSLLTMSGLLHAEEIGRVNTTFHLFGKDDQIAVDAFDDPKVQGITCYISRGVTGGVEGSLGIAEDPSEDSINCQKTGPILILGRLSNDARGETVFSESQSLVFKRLQVVRFLDNKRRVLIYLVRSHRVIEGSFYNSITAVPIGR